MIKVIAFDVFGTVVDFSGVPYDERKAYADHIHEHDGVKSPWKPLELPESWERLPAHRDSRKGLQLLRERYTVVTCSNGPLGLMTKLSKHNNLSWDMITPLELRQVFKPNLEAYLFVTELLGIKPSEMMMVTANEKFGDLEASAKLGMLPRLIRPNGSRPDLLDLAYDLLSRSDL